jgi:hypothetical protein
MKLINITKNLCFISLIVFCVNAHSGEKSVTQGGAVSTVTSKNITRWPMTLMVDDPFVLKINKWQEQQRKNKKDIINRKRINKKTPIDKLVNDDKANVIKLEVPENQEKVINTTKSFVFKDVTSRNNVPLLNGQDLNLRRRNIESLRRSMSVK